MFLKAFLPLLLAPLVATTPTSIEARQYITANDLDTGNCKDGTVVGPEVCDDLKMQLGGNVGCQGIGGAYTAGLAENFLPGNTAPQDVQAAVQVFEQCSQKCPKAKIVAGGYSQGSAVIDGSIQRLSGEVRDKVKAVVLFGFTRNLQDGGRIPGYPKDQTKVFCAVGDMVCDGTLIITAAHLTYGANAGEAASFLAQHVK
ncbi:hypothetical protein N7532_010065 [Penicillium argentinense]|uniref:Cutinase n=1 Tax=Penicillium argentinense TaxID=1131581 RepID=A0A9W9EP37_9EURO|nr:uncharacterized protein N7532_010065 [Penicillium argentinense]KAJ5085294.1 hypothetical protein N7532_010065 [Penicillium argentinense]